MKVLEKISDFFGKYMAIIVLVVAALALFAPKTCLWIQTSWVNYLLMIVMFGMGLTLKLEDFKLVIDIKAAEWLNDTEMNRYLRPDTLFGSKFEIYLNSVIPVQKTNNFVITKGMKM